MSSEATPLLASKSSPRTALLCGGRWLLDVTEVREWWHITWTAGVSYALRNSLIFIDVAFLGHLGTDALGAAALANVWIQMSSMWLFAGQEEVISTLVSQAWGHGNRKLAGAWLQLALIALVLLSIPIGITWVFAGRILSGLGFTPEALTEQAQIFCRWFLLALLPLGLNSAVQAWLNAMGSTLPGIATSAAAVVVSFICNYLLIFGTGKLGGDWPGLGFVGSPISTGIVNTVAFGVLLIIIARWRLHHHTCDRFHGALVCNRQNARTFVEQAVPNFIGMALETLQLQVLAGIVAHLGEVPLATHNALLNMYMLLTCFMFGAVRGSSIRVGHALGARRIDLAKQTMWVSMAGLGGLSLVTGALVFGLRNTLSRLFTSDPAVIDLAASVFPIMGLSMVLFSIEFVAIGVLLGQGRPGGVTGCIMVGNWLVCIPLAFVITRYTSLGLAGVWWALVLGYTVVTVLAALLMWRTDWQKCEDEAVARSAKEGLASPAGPGAVAPNADADASASLLASEHFVAGGAVQPSSDAGLLQIGSEPTLSALQRVAVVAPSGALNSGFES